MLVWCTLIVTIFIDGAPWKTETAVKGKVLSETKTQYTVDFSEYAQGKGYLGDYSDYVINKDNCIKDK